MEDSERWVCVGPYGVIGLGNTPDEAYRDWEQFERAMAEMTRPFGHATDTRNGVLPL